MDSRRRQELFRNLTEEECDALNYDWSFWARKNQLPPEGDWFCWLILAGRGFGKTRTAVEWIRTLVEGDSPCKAPKGAPERIALVADTYLDGRLTMIEGESGLLAATPRDFLPVFESTNKKLVWPNGIQAFLYSAESPDQLRGPQHHVAWADELAKWRYLEECWSNLLLGLRLGMAPKVIATTTPRNIPLLRRLVEDTTTRIIRGSTYDNKSNLPATFFDQVVEQYEGTRIGRQEIYGEILSDVPGALWNRDLLESIRVRQVAEVIWQISDNGLLSFKDILVRRRHRFRFDTDGNLRLITRDQPGGRLLPDRKMWTFSTGADNDDQPYGMGLAHWLYWPCLFKREGIKFWMMFLDKFGSPTPVGKYPQNATQKEKEQLLAATQAFQQESGIIIPEGMMLELIEATRGGRVDYAVQYNAMDAAISKVVLSQTMTTDSGSSLSQSQTHEGVRDDVVEADATEICDSFNRGPARWITEYNFPMAQIPEVRFITEDSEDLNMAADRDLKLDQLGYPPTENHIQETYGEGYQKSEVGSQKPEVGSRKSEVGSQKNFAEKPISAKIPPNRDDIDEFVDAHINDFQDQVGADVISIIQDVAARSTDFDDFVENLLEATADIKMPALTDLLARSGFNARLDGIVKK